MNRLAMVTVAGLCSFAPLRAQEGSLAPTAPVVPAPVLHEGKLVNPAGGRSAWGATSGPRSFSLSKWSPFRSPVSAGMTEPAVTNPYPYHGYVVPALPAGVSNVTPAPASGAACGPAGCGHARSGLSWEKLKSWLCYHPSKTELPKLRPTPYITPLQGMFPCASDCGHGCAPGNCAHGQPHGYGQPMPQPVPPTTQPVPMPKPGSSDGPVMMPPRSSQGSSLHPAMRGRPGPEVPNGYLYTPATVPATVVPTGLKVPQK